MSFRKTEVGRSIERATPWDAVPLVAWFPQALLYGFWQSHLGGANNQTKHARAWSSRIVGWYPAVASDDDIDYSRTNGTKGDPLNISKDVDVYVDERDTTTWSLTVEKGRKKSRPSEIGMGQVPSEASKRPLEPISFRRITQEEVLALTLSFGLPRYAPRTSLSEAVYGPDHRRSARFSEVRTSAFVERTPCTSPGGASGWLRRVHASAFVEQRGSIAA